MPFKLSTQIEGSSCRVTIDRLNERLILVRIAGHDIGEFGDAPMRCVDALVPEGHRAELYVDAREARGVAIDVSGAWAHWMDRRRDRLAAVHMLTASRFVGLSAEFARRFAGLEDYMRLYTDTTAFEKSLLEASTA